MGPPDPNQTGTDWSSWLSQITPTVVGAIAAERKQSAAGKLELEKLKLTQVNNGQVYQEGQTGVAVPPGTRAPGMSTQTLLMIGGAVLLVLVLLKRG